MRHPSHRNTSLRRILLLAAAGALGLAVSSAPAHAGVTCDRYASAGGSDLGGGTAAAPYRTTQRLVSSLAPGQVGCLTGSFVEDVTIRIGGQPGAPITLTSAPGTRASLTGRLWIADSANWVTVSDLNLNGRNVSNLPSPTVNGDEVVFRGNDVTNGNTGICFVLGSQAYGIAVDVLLDGNRIHDCGRLPATNHDHGVYLEATRNAVIRGNWIYSNADRGVQLYPDAQGSLIERNLIAGNGTGIVFSGDTAAGAGTGGAGYFASSNNVVRGNIIAANLRYNVDSWWAGTPGTGNVVDGNCLGATAGTSIGGDGGFAVGQNVSADLAFPRMAAGDFGLPATGPCAGMGPGTVSSSSPATPVSTPATPAPPVIAPIASPPAAPQPTPVQTVLPPTPVAAPVNLAAPTITLSQVLRRATASTGSWSSNGRPLTFTFQWQRCDANGAACVPIAGATGSAYNLGASDQGSLRVAVTASAGGATATTISAPARLPGRTGRA